MEARSQDSWATDSDHIPVVGKLPYPLTRTQRAAKKILTKKKFKGKSKPSAWYLSDPMFSHAICDEVGVDAEDKLDSKLADSDLIGAFHCLTDGSFLRGEGAGLAFATFRRGDHEGKLKPLLTAAGPIVTLRKSQYFVGVERLTSCVAELNAVVERLLR